MQIKISVRHHCKSIGMTKMVTAHNVREDTGDLTTQRAGGNTMQKVIFNLCFLWLVGLHFRFTTWELLGSHSCLSNRGQQPAAEPHSSYSGFVTLPTRCKLFLAPQTDTHSAFAVIRECGQSSKKSESLIVHVPR